MKTWWEGFLVGAIAMSVGEVLLAALIYEIRRRRRAASWKWLAERKMKRNPDEPIQFV